MLTCCLLLWSCFLGLGSLRLGCSRLRSCRGLGCWLALGRLSLLGCLLELVSQLVAGFHLDKLACLFQTFEVVVQQFPAWQSDHNALGCEGEAGRGSAESRQQSTSLPYLKFSGSLPLCSLVLSQYFAIACGEEPFRSFKLTIASLTRLW